VWRQAGRGQQEAAGGGRGDEQGAGGGHGDEQGAAVRHGNEQGAGGGRGDEQAAGIGHGDQQRAGMGRGAGADERGTGMSLIEARDVVLSFGQTPALRGADLAVQAGEILAIMGPSGSGKSTLLHCLAGILVPEEGEIWFDGHRVDTMSETGRSGLRRDRFGFVFQFGQLVPELTAEENVALPLLLNGVRRRRALSLVRPWFGRLGLDGLEGRRSGELSGGQAQRVALARGLVAEPRVLFADEPTGSLDSLTGEQVMDLLVSAAREQGTTVVLVTHEPRVAAYADREVIVRDGKVHALTVEAVPS
jgi:putative ABC transport system ATP-binding protein